MRDTKIDRIVKLLAGILAVFLWGFWGISVPVCGVESAHVGHSAAKAEFLGIIPGETTVASLASHPIFGKPVQKEVADGYYVMTYQLPELPEMPYIQLMTRSNIVEGVVVHLERARDLTDAKKSFESAIGDARPILVPDGAGNFREIYPEKGLVFVLEQNESNAKAPSTRVIQIIAETLKADFFSLRAAQDLKKSFTVVSLSSVRDDAIRALELNPQSASAHWILAQVAFWLEDYEEAKTEAIAAVSGDDSIPQFHLTLMNILAESERSNDGMRYLAAVRDVCDKPPFFRAETLILAGTFAREGDAHDTDAAIRDHRLAVDLLLPLLKESDVAARVLAKRMILRAYLELALDIAEKDWPNVADREKAFLWLDAAAEIAGSLVRDEKLSSDVMLTLCLGAVKIAHQIPGSSRSDTYLEKIIPLGDMLTKNCSDPLNFRMISWKCGGALVEACRIAEQRNDTASGVRYAKAAYKYLAEFCEKQPEKVRAKLGEVDYDLGMMLVRDPAESDLAQTGFARVIRQIEQVEPVASVLENGENGIRLVNIGKLYWTEGRRERGFELTQRGADLIARAIDADVFDENELVVPCKNLLAMAESLEKQEAAAKFRVLLAELTTPTDSAASGEQGLTDEPSDTTESNPPLVAEEGGEVAPHLTFPDMTGSFPLETVPPPATATRTPNERL